MNFETKGNNRIIYYVLAFIAGHREATFRELLQRATDLILKPSDSPADPPTPPRINQLHLQIQLLIQAVTIQTHDPFWFMLELHAYISRHVFRRITASGLQSSVSQTIMTLSG